jgi:glycosyltransferase involved in cell wall biosynthesis
MDALQHSLAGAPKEPATLIALGRLSAETGQREEALSYYRRAADFLPTDAECWIDIARGAQELGEPDLFEAALRQARELDPRRTELTEFAHDTSAAQPRNEVLSQSNERLERFRDRHRGKRCVIIGNGPSLKRMDLSFLRNEITFGLNRIYMLSNDLEFQPNYYVCMNPLVLEQSSREIQAIRAPKFLSAQCMHLFPDAEDTVFLQPMPGPDFALDPSRGVWEGYTVTYVAMQLAYYMGFSEVVLIGVDHEYSYPPGRPNQEVVSTGDDPNHFHPQYFGAGVRWHLPDLTNAEVAYRLAHDRFRGDGRSVIDATVDGKLNIFPKRDYREIFVLDSAVEPDHESQQPQPALMAARSGSAYKVTAIVSTYAAERLLESCLEDLERQTIAAQTEIIVVDSGSPENEERIVREFQRRHTNIVYIRTCRETLYEAWNRGVAMARGEYLTNANTDDRHRADAFERMVSELDRREVGIVYADSLITTTENEAFEDHSADRIWRLPPFSVRQVLMDCPFGAQPMWRRVLHDDIGLFEGKYRLAGDYELFMRLAIEHGAHHLDEILGLYYESQNNLSYNQDAMQAELDDFLVRYRSTTPLEKIYPFMEQDRSDEARIAAWFDFANHLVWMTPYPALEYAEEIYRKLIARTGERVELLHNLALALLLQERPDEGAALLRDLAPRSEIAAHNLRLLEAGQDVNPRDLEVATIAHPALQSLMPVIPAWQTRVSVGG